MGLTAGIFQGLLATFLYGIPAISIHLLVAGLANPRLAGWDAPPEALAWKDRYRRIRYTEIDPNARKPWFLLGSAVAASAAVPGLFPPLAVSNLYENRRVQLVDGGVFDNQGVTGLLDLDFCCNAFVVSDASGQSLAQDNPKPDLASVLGSTTSILMARVREEVINNLISSNQDNPERVAYFHLTRGLLAQQHDAAGQASRPELHARMAAGVTRCEDDYGVTAEMQKAIAQLRTDLDSFTDTEALALQADAYLMSERPLRALSRIYPITETPHDWRLLSIAAALTQGDERVLTQLQIGKNLAWKPLKLAWSQGLGSFAGLTLYALPLTLVFGAYGYVAWWGLSAWLAPHSALDVATLQPDAVADLLKLVLPPLTVAGLNLALASFAERVVKGSGKLVSWIRKLVSVPQELLSLTLRFLVFPVLICIPFWLYVHTINRYYVKLGRYPTGQPGSVRPLTIASDGVSEQASG